MKLSILVPAYNESATILIVLERLRALDLKNSSVEKEVVIVDDNSTDNTAKLITDFIKDIPNFSYHKHDVNQGKGAAVRTAFNSSTGEIVVIQDADLELTPDDIPKMLEVIMTGKIDFVNGSRYLPGPIRPLYSFKRYFANKVFTIITSILIDVRLTDLACGYKMVRRSLYEKLNLKEDKFGYETELIIKAMRYKKNTIAEVPVVYFPRNEGEGKKLKNMDGVRIFWTIIKYGLLRFS